jgi:hypothetical protein
MEERRESGPNVTYLITFKKEASLNEVILVLNSLGLATSSKDMADEFEQYPGIQIKEVGILGSQQGR